MNIQRFNHSWLIGLKGIAAILMGVIFLLYPVQSTKAFLLILGFLIAIGGIALIIFAINNPMQSLRKWFLIEGVSDLLIAILIIISPYNSALVFALLFGVWFLISSLFRLRVYHQRKAIGADSKLPLLNGILTFTLSLAIILHPIAGIMAFAYLVGITSVLFGFFLLTTSIRWRKLSKISK